MQTIGNVIMQCFNLNYRKLKLIISQGASDMKKMKPSIKTTAQRTCLHILVLQTQIHEKIKTSTRIAIDICSCLFVC